MMRNNKIIYYVISLNCTCAVLSSQQMSETYIGVKSPIHYHQLSHQKTIERSGEKAYNQLTH